MTLEELRAKYPQYSEIPDEQFLRGVHSKLYPNKAFEEFAGKIEGYEPPAPPAPKPNPERTLTDDIVEGGSALLNAQLAGLGDELTGITRATLDSLLPKTRADRISEEITGESADRPLTLDAYEMYRDEAKERKENFREARPGIALATEVTGGVLSPLTLAKAPAALSLLAPKLPGAATIARYLPAWTPQAVRAGVEGGFYGFNEGEGSFGERLEDAQSGAAFGVGTSSFLSGAVSPLARAIYNQRVTQELLQEGKDGVKRFIPINLASPDTPLGRWFREGPGAAYISGGKIKAQEANAIASNPRLAQFQDDVNPGVGAHELVREMRDSVEARASDAAEQGKRKARGLQDTIAEMTRDATEWVEDTTRAGTRRLASLADEGEEALDAVTDAGRVAEREARDQGAAMVDDVVVAGREAVDSTKDSIPVAVTQVENKGSRDLIEYALPAQMDDATKDAIRSAENTLEASQLLDQWYRGPQAFSSVNDAVFTWNPQYQAALLKSLRNNPDAFNEAASRVGGADRLVELLTPPVGTTGIGTLSGRISGKDLMDIRNSAAGKANAPRPSSKAARNRSIADDIDDMIEDQLDPKAFELYSDQLDKYGMKVAISEASEVANKGNRVNVTPAEVLKKTSRATRMIPGRERARAAATAVEEAEKEGKSVLKLTVESTKAQAKEAREGKRALERAASDEALESRRAVRAGNKQSRQEVLDEVDNAREIGKQAKEDIQDYKLDRTRRLEDEAKRAKDVKAASMNRIERETRGMTPESNTFWSRLAATASMVNPMGQFGAAAPLGALALPLVGGQKVQTLLAGQTGWQKAVARTMETQKAQAAAEAIRRGIERTSALRAPDDEENY